MQEKQAQHIRPDSADHLEFVFEVVVVEVVQRDGFDVEVKNVSIFELNGTFFVFFSGIWLWSRQCVFRTVGCFQ
jgi:hypothetical protein